MSEVQHLPAWDEVIGYAEEGPGKRMLVQSDSLKSVLVGLGAGLSLPPHPAPTTVFHILEGTGWIVTEDERIPVKAKETVIVPAGIPRGVDADTRMALLVAHGA